MRKDVLMLACCLLLSRVEGNDTFFVLIFLSCYTPKRDLRSSLRTRNSFSFVHSKKKITGISKLTGHGILFPTSSLF